MTVPLTSAIPIIEDKDCNGFLTAFDFSFPLLSASDLRVKVVDSDGNETLLAATTDYELSTVNADYTQGGTITTVTYDSGSRVLKVWAAGNTISLYRETAIIQPQRFIRNGYFDLASLEKSFDKLTMISQELMLAKVQKGDPGPQGAAGENGTDGEGAVDVAAHYGGYTMAAINTAIAAIGSSTPTQCILRPGTWAITANLDLCTYTNITWRLPAGAVLVVATGCTLTMPIPDAGKYKIFSLTGTGAVVLVVGYTETIYPEWWMTGSVDSTTAIQAAINATSAHCKLKLDGIYAVSDDIAITDKADITITGMGTINFSISQITGKIMLKFVGVCSNIIIEELTLVGGNNNLHYEEAVGNFSGQTLSDITIRNLKIRDFNVGIDVGADLSGTVTACRYYNNHISNIVGEEPGQGYGIMLARTTYADVHDNVISGCQRHSIYQGSGNPAHNEIHSNIIVDHRKGVAADAYRPAISIARSSYVKVYDNYIIDFYDCGMSIEPDKFTSTNCEHIEIYGNSFVGRKGNVPALLIGTQEPLAGYYAKFVSIYGNAWHTDYAYAGGGEIIILNGQNITIMDNIFTGENVHTNNYIIQVGYGSYIGASEDCDYINIKRNAMNLSGSDLTQVTPICIDEKVSTTYHPHVDIADNLPNGISPGPTEVVYGAYPTNPNMSVKGMTLSTVIGGVGPGVAAGSTAGKAKTTQTFTFLYTNLTRTMNPSDNFWTIGSEANTGAGEFRKILLCVDYTAGVYIVGEVAASQADARVPKLPHHRYVPVGIIEIGESWTAGSALSGNFVDIVTPYYYA